MTINELLLEGRKRLSGAKGFCVGGAPDGALEAEVLLAHVLGLSREELLRDGSSARVSPQDAELFLRYVDEVAGGRPVAYITNSKEFYGMDFYVDERVLVPRPETEMMVDEVLDFLNAKFGFAESREAKESLKNDVMQGNEELPTEPYYPVRRVGSDEVDEAEHVFQRFPKMLDIGTGSLNIAAAVVRHFGHIYVHAVDVSDEALEVAQINREAHGLETYVELYKSDLLSDVDEKEFDVIVANLPYVGEVRNRNLADNVLKFEPSCALFGGRDGLELYKKMIQQIFDKKIRFDLMVGEFGFGQARSMRGILSKFFDQGEKRAGGRGGAYKREIKNDLSGIPRIFVVKRTSAGNSIDV